MTDSLVTLNPDDFSQLTGPEFFEEVFRYEGLCPVSSRILSLPRTKGAEMVCQRLAESLNWSEGKMLGVLLVETASGVLGYLKAFSGKLEGSYSQPGWVPPLLELDPSELETNTKARLSQIRDDLSLLSASLLREELDRLNLEWDEREKTRKSGWRENKHSRQQRRARGESEEILSSESKQDSREKRDFKAARRRALASTEKRIAEVSKKVSQLKAERRSLSRALQEEMHQRFSQAMWSQEPWSLASLFPGGPPTGVGDCCAPKLLGYAKRKGLKPLAMAESWLGPEREGRIPGEFYPACRERCQPLLGPLLHRGKGEYITALYEDHSLMVVDKPSGILSVPGRHLWNQDSVLSRLKHRQGEVFPVHRLDMDTSGLLVLAKNVVAQSALQAQFAQRRVKKSYQALLSELPERDSGLLDLAIGRHPQRPGSYRLDVSGKDAKTEFELLSQDENRFRFRPITGRSHQIRVHAAQGLGAAIRGDRLYGSADGEIRLYLHAENLTLMHPETGRPLELYSEVPF